MSTKKNNNMERLDKIKQFYNRLLPIVKEGTNEELEEMLEGEIPVPYIKDILNYHDDEVVKIGDKTEFKTLPLLFFSLNRNIKNDKDNYDKIINTLIRYGAKIDLKLGKKEKDILIYTFLHHHGPLNTEIDKFYKWLDLQPNYKEYLEELKKYLTSNYQNLLYFQKILSFIDYLLANNYKNIPRYKEDEYIFAKDMDGKWLPAVIIQEILFGYNVHFLGYANKFDEYILITQDRLKKVSQEYQNMINIEAHDKDQREVVEIDEEQFLKMNCEDVIHMKTRSNSCFFDNDDEMDNNILFILEKDDKYFIDCSKRSYIEKMMDDGDRIMLPCHPYNRVTGTILGDSVLNVQNFADDRFKYLKLDFSFGCFYFSIKDVEEMMSIKNKIFYIDEENNIIIPRTASLNIYKGGSVVSGNHCQKGTDIHVYTIKICGGEKCLHKIFGDDDISVNSETDTEVLSDSSDYEEEISHLTSQERREIDDIFASEDEE